MEIKSDYTVSANRERVWEHLTDPDLLSQCIPGCEELKATGGDTYEAIIKVGVAGIKGTYKGTVTLENMQPPSAYRSWLKERAHRLSERHLRFSIGRSQSR